MVEYFETAMRKEDVQRGVCTLDEKVRWERETERSGQLGKLQVTEGLNGRGSRAVDT